ncbi:hypothetical protein [Deefgea salmonis]|uniref:Uncharacterized protein n=1 Tax=Deefgea salmonis TaxID=2875502 RepID=A0ABS8BKQ5_9NEIS|nr:hypothetical protein [Deefgea salmonis]MCB5196307.1 hypothetical protein [Deefgea salmonis]
MRKILGIVAVVLASAAWAEDAPLPFDTPAAAVPIVRKAAVSKAPAAPAARSVRSQSGNQAKKSRHPSSRSIAKAAPAQSSTKVSQAKRKKSSQISDKKSVQRSAKAVSKAPAKKKTKK